MKKNNWFKYGQFMRYGFDLARMFPIIIKQRGISKYIAGITSQIVDTPNTFWLYLINLDLQLKGIFPGLLPRCLFELDLNNLILFRLETTMRSFLG